MTLFFATLRAYDVRVTRDFFTFSPAGEMDWRQRECFRIPISCVTAVSLVDGSYDPAAIPACVGWRSRAKDPRVSRPAIRCRRPL